MTLLRKDPPRRDEALRFLSVARALRPDSHAVYAMLCGTLGDMGAWEEAAALCQEAVRVKADSAVMHHNYGMALAAKGREQQAIAEYREAIALQPDFAEAYSSLGSALANTGRLDEALKLREEVLALRRDKLGLDHPETLNSMNVVAWFLATAADPKFRNPARAAEHAKKAVELAPKEGDFWNTLGVAHYRAGDWKTAIEALEKSMQLRKGGDSLDWFFLAMARWQLGDKERARKWYDQAVQWMEKNNPKDNELRRFHAEAAALLGLTEKKR